MRRPDQSMSLLAELQENALEPEYAEVAARGAKSSRWALGVTITLLSALLVVAFVGTTRSSGDVASERAELLDRVGEQEQQLQSLESDVRALDAEIRKLGSAQVSDPVVREEMLRLEPLTGAVPVTGPGIVVVVNDASDASSEGLVFDSDLARLVNGLWQAGAEAIAINGRRLTALTPIRNAGSAITIGYVSLSPPYRVEAIGDPNTLQSRFARTAAAAWWKYISDNYGVRFKMQAADGTLELDAGSGMNLRFATR